MCLLSNRLESRSGPHVISHFSTRKYRTHGSFHHFSTRKYRADGSSRYLVPGSTEQTDHSIISVPASTEQMGRLGIWYFQIPNIWIISSFRYSQVPSRWVVSVSGTLKYGANGSFWLLVPSSAEHHYVHATITTRYAPTQPYL